VSPGFTITNPTHSIFGRPKITVWFFHFLVNIQGFLLMIPVPLALAEDSILLVIVEYLTSPLSATLNYYLLIQCKKITRTLRENR